MSFILSWILLPLDQLLPHTSSLGFHGHIYIHYPVLRVCVAVGFEPQCRRTTIGLEEKYESLFNSFILYKVETVQKFHYSQPETPKTAQGHCVDLHIKYLLELYKPAAQTWSSVDWTELRLMKCLKAQYARENKSTLCHFVQRKYIQCTFLEERGSPFSKQSSNLMKWNEWEWGGMVNRLWKHFIS